MKPPNLGRVKRALPLLVLAGVGALTLGLAVALLPALRESESLTLLESPDVEGDSATVLTLATQPPSDRRSALEDLVQQGDGLGQAQARYLLATDLINQNQGGSALPLLADLEEDLPGLAPYVLIQRGRAATAASQPEVAQQTWQTLINDYAEEPAAAEGLYQLGQTQPDYWDQLLQAFPAHPRSVAVAEQRLVAGEGDEFALLTLLARHGLHRPNIEGRLDQLVETYADRLTAEDWQGIGFGYWELGRYGKAGEAYGQADPSALTLYRAARGSQLGGRREAAIATYRLLNRDFPDAPENGLGLMRLAGLLPEALALPVLDVVIERFPDRAGEALLERANLLDAMDSAASAQQARQSVLSQHGDSNAAAELRYRQAEQRAQTQDYAAAYDLADQILTESPNSDLAPRAGFWQGKWAIRQGDTAAATAAFERVLGRYPQSYYAWRSAAALNLDVGDFDTVRQKTPQIDLPAQRPQLLSGSETLQTLYQLGQDQDAWALWQVEFEDPEQPSVEAQFTDGVLRLGVGDHLDGMFMVSSLAWRDDPADQAVYQSLAQSDAYWQALYPFPFLDLITTWSAQRQLNPLLVTALIRQESRFEPQIRSGVGAAGLMQVMPETAEWIQFQADLPDYNLDDPNDNIKLGTWYLDYTHREFDNQSLYAVASYNAGPGSIANWLQRDNFRDVDEFVEVIPFPETRGYVEEVFGGYWNYLRLYNPEVAAKVDDYTQRYAALSLYN
jgi:soluble lytic murein transglycosylase